MTKPLAIRAGCGGDGPAAFVGASALWDNQAHRKGQPERSLTPSRLSNPATLRDSVKVWRAAARLGMPGSGSCGREGFMSPKVGPASRPPFELSE